MELIKKPKYIAPELYQSCIEKVKLYLSKDDAVHSIYQMGNVNHPGISDLDFIVVFKNNTKPISNIDDILTDDDKYLITHDIGAIAERHFRAIKSYAFWDNLKCLHGKDISNDNSISLPNKELHTQQLALEYLIKNYIEITLQLAYGVIKQRTVLQEIKGVRYDVALLGLENTELDRLVKLFINWLDCWFEKTPSKKDFFNTLIAYQEALARAIYDLTQDGKKLWLPKTKKIKYGRNITLHLSNRLEFKKKGMFLPSKLIRLHQKAYNAQLRINSFEFYLPISHEDENGLMEQRRLTYSEHKSYVEEYLTQFGPLVPGILNRFL